MEAKPALAMSVRSLSRAPARGISLALLMRGALLALAVAVLALGVTIVRDRQHAQHWGLTYEANTSMLLVLDRAGAAARAGLHPGDVLTAVDLLPPGAVPGTIDGMLPVSIKHGDGLRMTMLTAPANGLSWDLVALLIVAGGLWLGGSVVGLWAPLQPAARYFALFALTGALALCCAVAQDPVLGWAQWVLGPAQFVAIGAYVLLQRSLVGHPSGRWSSPWIETALCAQGALMLAALLLGPRVFGSQTGATLAALSGLDLAALLILAHALAIGRLGREAPAPARRRVRLALLVGLAAWLPALALGWAPPMATLLGIGYITPLPPYSGAIGLAALALGYPAIVLRGDLFWLEVAIRRALVTLVVGGALIVLAALLWWIVVRLFHPSAGTQVVLGVLAALLALPVFEPARRTMQGGLDRRLTMGQFDYGPALQAVADALLPGPGQMVFDARTIAGVLVGHVPALLGISTITVWLRNAGQVDWLLFDGTAPDGRSHALPPALAATPRGPFMARHATVDGSDARSASPTVWDVPALSSAAVLCVPVHLAGDLRAVLLLGPRDSQDPYRTPDRAALVLLARQIAAALQLVDLLADLRARNAELAQLTGRLARAREEERKHLSRELHDAVVQDLVAVTRQLRRHQQGTLPEAIWQDLIAQTQEALTTTRRICNDLRPAILDLGLTSAVRELIERTYADGRPIRVQLEVCGAEQRVAEECEFALYRVIQESLANVVKHAQATDAVVSVRFMDMAVEVCVQDHGRGFVVPDRLEELAGDHLGLIGIRERLAVLGGTVQLTSQPGQGTLVCAQVPY
ncbi:MAG TPA: GAF domain-containing sensor histidine kinase [Chloroflexota bacterium]|nr:GAF domain-containing sensor histidine kinase [Chloroflexota bacterium]